MLHSGVGAITETDVLLASASNAIIVGFNVRPERNAQAAAEQEKVDIRLHTIIYELADEIKQAMTGLLEPVFKEVYKGRAQVREVFRISKVGTVAGCHGATTASITRNSEVRLLRDNVVVHTGKIEVAQALQERRERSEGGLRVRHLARELQRHQAGRRDRGVRDRARRARSLRLATRSMPSRSASSPSSCGSTTRILSKISATSSRA